MGDLRVVSLLPSATEIVCRLGQRARLVGRSAECDFPVDVAELPVVMRARVSDGNASSSAIDARVRAARGRGESLYELDVPLLRALRPDLLLTQDLCGVCSVTGDEVAAACRSAGIAPRIVSLTPRTLEEVLENIRTVADALGVPLAGRGLIAELMARQRAVGARPVGRAVRVAVVEWIDPPILAGLWAPEMVRWAGGRPYGPVRAGEPGIRTEWSSIREDPPDRLVLAPCSFPVERTLGELAASPVGELLGGRPNGSVWVVDEAHFSRPGPRLWDGIELLADLLDGRSPRTRWPALPWNGPLPEVLA